MPHISVMIPVYNRAHLIGHTIQSILEQEFEDWDLVVVDDASYDQTVEVVEEYRRRDERVSLTVNGSNLGLTRNWNRCIDLARGPLVQIVQSDDLIDSDYLTKVSEVFDEHPRLGFVAASCRYIDIKGKVVSPGSPRPSRLYRGGDEAITAILGGGGHPHTSSIVVRGKCYDEVGGFNEEIWHGPDVEMDVRLAAHYDYYRFGEVCTSYRRHGTNIGQIEFLRRDYLAVQEKKFNLMLSHLSRKGQRSLGIDDLGRYITVKMAKVALSGVVSTLAYGRADLARYYLGEALRYDARSLLRRRFWKSIFMVVLPGLSRKLIQKRMGFSASDYAHLASYKESMRAHEVVSSG